MVKLSSFIEFKWSTISNTVRYFKYNYKIVQYSIEKRKKIIPSKLFGTILK